MIRVKNGPAIRRISYGSLKAAGKRNLVAVLAVVSEDESKINFGAVCGPEAVKKGAHAGKIIKQVAAITGGGGGGRPESAKAGGKDVAKLEEALEAVNNIVEAIAGKN